MLHGPQHRCGVMGAQAKKTWQSICLWHRRDPENTLTINSFYTFKPYDIGYYDTAPLENNKLVAKK